VCCTQDSIFTYGKTLESCLLYKQQFPHFEGSFMGKWIRIFGFLFCHDKTSVTSIGQTNLKFSSLRRPAQLISKTSHVALLHLPLSKGQLSNEQKRTMAKHKKLLQLAIETWVLKLHDRRFTSSIRRSRHGFNHGMQTRMTCWMSRQGQKMMLLFWALFPAI